MGMMWHLERVDSAPDQGPVGLVCLSNENPVKFTMRNSVDGTYDVTQACVAVDATGDEILTMLQNAGYVPNDFGLPATQTEETDNGNATRTEQTDETDSEGRTAQTDEPSASTPDLLERHQRGKNPPGRG